MSVSEDPGDTHSDDLRIDSATVERLRSGDGEAWRRFLTDYHSVFVRAVRGATWRIFKGSPQQRSFSHEELTDDAKTYFYRAFQRSFRRYDGEGRFRAFLFRTVQNCLMERFRVRHREISLLPEDDERVESPFGVTPASVGADPAEELYHCVYRLPNLYRLVIMMRLEATGRSLSALATDFGVSIEAIHKRFQRALALLKECLEQRIGAGDDV